jgi:hypothetical protein
MGTRSLTILYSEYNTMYRHSDGYVKGHGHDLAKLLQGLTIVNGLNDSQGKVANGMPCLAATIVASLKTGPGGIYLYRNNPEDTESYMYHIRGTVGSAPEITVVRFGEEIFKGSAEQLLEFQESD